MKYTITENTLHKGSFTPKVITGARIDIQTMSRNIIAKTTLTEGTIKSVMSAIREEAVEGLAQGNVIVIDDLCTISVSLGGNFDSADTVVTPKTADLRVNLKSDVSLKKEILAHTHLEKVMVAPKMPFMVSVQSLPHHLTNFYMPHAPIRISGKNLEFHENNVDEGVFCVKADSTEYRVPYFSVAGDKRIDFTLPGNFGDITLKILARYTENGQLHHGEYEHTIKVMIATMFETTMVVRSYEGTSGNATITRDRTTGGLMYQANGDTGGLPTPITGNGTYQLISGTATNTITIEVVDYESYNAIVSKRMVVEDQIELA